MATERFAGGRGMALETQVSVKANPFYIKKSGQYHSPFHKDHIPQYPVVMRNKEKYRPPVAMVESETMYPMMTTHHQLAIWKNRSPVLSIESFISSNDCRIARNHNYLHARH